MSSVPPSPAEISPLIALYNAGRYAELESRARLLTTQYPDFGFGWKLLGGALQMQGKNALAAFQKTAELMPNEADAHYNLGVVLSDLGKLDDALASYRRAVKIKPDFAEAHNNLGYLLQKLAQPEAALASCRRALELKPDYAEAHNNMGNALKDLGRLDEAVASYRSAIKLKPDFALAHNNLGNALQALGQFGDAAGSFRRAVEIKPDYAEAHNSLAVVLESMKQFEAALASYRRALQLAPNSADMHYNQGNVLKELGQLDEAAASYRRALEINPDYAQAHNNLGIVLKARGQLDGALDCYRRALATDPDFVLAHNNLGITLHETGRFDDAAASFRRAIELKPNYTEAHYNLGNTLKKLGQPDASAACFKSCLESDPQDRLGARLILAALNIEPMPAKASEAHLEAFYNNKAAVWDKNLGSAGKYYGAELVAQALGKLAGKAVKLDILDAGCGTGHVGLLVRDRANRLDGVDMSPSMLEKAREKNIYDKLYQSDLESFMQNNPDRYDAIACAATLIHFGDLSPVFGAAATCLRDDGLFVFTVFKNDSGQDDKEVVVAQIDELARSGCYAHSRGYLIRLAETSGFTVEMLDAGIHEYHKNNAAPIMCFVAGLRRRNRLNGNSA